MPTYEYVCDTCENDFEVVQKMSDSPLKSCPECGEEVRRVISGGLGIAFRGSGFYVNDGVRSSNTCNSSSKECTGCSRAK